jgi:hypothetical protein
MRINRHNIFFYLIKYIKIKNNAYQEIVIV